MTTAERDLVEALRAELAAVDPPRHCCRIAESAGLAGAYPRRRHSIARLTLRLGRGRGGEPVDGSGGGPVAGGSAVVSRAGLSVAVGAIAGPSGISGPAGLRASADHFVWSRAAEHCRIAYLRGRFLAHGSLSLASGRTHLEFVLPVDEARALCDHLTEMGMPATWRIRRGRGVVTWKSVETVVTFLKTLGGGSSLLELEARQVSRSVRGDLNRVINAESANLTRVVAASARQLEAIDALESDGRLAEQPYTVRLVAAARREEPEATFTELAERLDLHRSAVQRALERIERLVLHPEDGAVKRGRGPGRRHRASRPR
jgi:WhiA C-terminal HTH domain/WhiA LAGLIDADG-like domain